MCRDSLSQRQATHMSRSLADRPEDPDESSRLWPSRSAHWVTDSQPKSLADTHQNHPECREASEISYAYRPMPIDHDSQQKTFLSSSLPLNNTSPVVSNRTTDTHQALAPIEENDEMPYDPSGNFIMNPEAPVFVPRQTGARPGMLTLPCNIAWGPCLTDLTEMKPRNPRDWVYYGDPQPKPGQVSGK